ncbi:MAG: tRNA (adenosine(37)-N6)-dimethylallyltransferase MiaA [Chthoniobacter sp.]|nr:tRNA (adenosine(37)-N6)-dimethylallyltransferase MiaA [Chthoniobacter sp.]
MSSAPPNFFIIAGPTAVGKSDAAVAVAERCGGEIIGADAFQIYRGLDILTAKPSPASRARVPHHLIGEIPLTQSFDVAQYLSLGHERIAQIRARGRVPIVVGGTGLYLRALMRGLADLPGANPELRAGLEARSLAELQHQLAELDPEGAQRVDLQNPRRVIRALEVCLLTGRPFSSFREQWSAESSLSCGVVLTLDRDILHSRIADRTAAMFAAGVVDEVTQCGELGPTAGQVLGLREIRAHVRGEMTRAQCFEALAQSTRQYAKRQMTWFRREPSLKMIDLSSLSADELINRLAAQAAAFKAP